MKDQRQFQRVARQPYTYYAFLSASVQQTAFRSSNLESWEWTDVSALRSPFAVANLQSSGEGGAPKTILKKRGDLPFCSKYMMLQLLPYRGPGVGDPFTQHSTRTCSRATW